MKSVGHYCRVFRRDIEQPAWWHPIKLRQTNICGICDLPLVSPSMRFLVGALFALTVALAPASGHDAVAEKVMHGQAMLIIAGEGLIPMYDDTRVAATWLSLATAFAHALRAELTSRGISAWLYLNAERSAKPIAYLPQLLAARASDALIQVRIDHIKNASENTVHLEANAMKLCRISGSSEYQRIITRPGTIKRYVILSKNGEDHWDTPVTILARDFTNALEADGKLAMPCESYQESRLSTASSTQAG